MNNDEYLSLSVASDNYTVLYDFSLTVKVATLIFISGRSSDIPSAKERKSVSTVFIIW